MSTGLTRNFAFRADSDFSSQQSQWSVGGLWCVSTRQTLPLSSAWIAIKLPQVFLRLSFDKAWWKLGKLCGKSTHSDGGSEMPEEMFSSPPISLAATCFPTNCTWFLFPKHYKCPQGHGRAHWPDRTRTFAPRWVQPAAAQPLVRSATIEPTKKANYTFN